MITSFYSIKLIQSTFITLPRSSKSLILNISYSKFSLSTIYFSLPIFILSLFSIMIGFFLKDIFIGIGIDT
jgi:NADH:ubiquinone oxidoreductase subunit 5 (subunit L)/multisubunit Na+/H+ antiporter MnhA subunit